MFKKLLILTLISNIICESAFARAGGRSSFGSSGRSSTSYFNQGSRGSRTYDGGGSNGRNYAPMQKSTRQEAPKNNQSATNSQQNQQQPNPASSFFQRNPMLSTIGAVLAGSWLGHMIFGSGGFGGYGAGSGAGGGFMMNFLIMALCAFAAVKLFKYFARRQNPHFESAPCNATTVRSVNISLPESEKQKFAELLVEIQNAWSEQDSEKLKRLTTPEIAKYFSDSLSQNISQNIANKVENIEVTAVEIAESWQEEEMEYATVVLEWSSLDYMVNLNKTAADSNYVIEGSNENLVITSEAWTFARYNGNGKWILSAIAQIE